MWRRALALVYFEVTADEVTGSWVPGPLPVEMPDGRCADRGARVTYFQPRATDSLYGPADGSSVCRWHREVEDGGTGIGVTDVELLSLPRYGPVQDAAAGGTASGGGSGRYLAVLHMRLSAADPVGELEGAVRLAPDSEAGVRQREMYTELLGPGFRIGEHVRRAQSVALLTSRDKPEAPAGAPETWSAETGWLWYAASATGLETFCPDPDDPHVLDGLVYLSASWRALVLRDGISFLGLVRDDASDEGGFFPWAEAYVRSLYTDAALLAALQRDGLNDFGNRLARIGDRFEKSAEFRRLVNEITEFRNVFWWDDVTHHGAANDLLLRMHAAHRTPNLFARVVADIDAFKQQVEAQALEASLQIQVVEEKRSRILDHVVSIAIFAFAVPALVFAGLAVPADAISFGGHAVSRWFLLIIGVAALMLGAVAGGIGGRWLANKRT